MYDDERDSDTPVWADACPEAEELGLLEYDWAVEPRAETGLSVEEIEQVLAILAVMDLDDDEDEATERPRWLH